MTAHATIEERQECLDAGINANVSSPIDASLLSETLERFVSPTSKSTTVSPQHPTRLVVAKADELPNVPGLNTAEGLLRVAGNQKLYRKLLRQFANTEADAAQRVGTALAENDRVLAERLAHSVKGVSANIGAHAVQNAASHLEKAIATSAPAAEIEAWRASLADCLAEVVYGLKTALERADSEPVRAVDPAQLKNVVERLSRYLAESNAAAADYFEEAGSHLRSLFEEHQFEHFAGLVESFMFPEAYQELMAAVVGNDLERRQPEADVTARHHRSI